LTGGARTVHTPCAALDDRLKSLDNMGRTGSLSCDLDWVRRERKSARDGQYRLRR